MSYHDTDSDYTNVLEMRADWEQMQEAEEREKRECQGCLAYGINPGNEVGDKFIWVKRGNFWHREPRCDDCVAAALQGRIKRDLDSNDPHNWPDERPNQGGWLGHTFTKEDTK